MTDVSYGKGVMLHTIRIRKAFSEVVLGEANFRTAGGNCYGKPIEPRQHAEPMEWDDWMRGQMALADDPETRRMIQDMQKRSRSRRRRTELAKRQKRHLKALERT